jgi:hypothetical protein
MPSLKVISLFAGPGAGKSTTAAALFNLMKRQRYAVELVTEVAKDWTYERNVRLGDQLSVLAEQNWRLQRLEGQGVEWVITDSPLALSLAYAQPKDADWLEQIVDVLWHRYDNFPIRLQRTNKVYQTFGRSQTLEEAKALDLQINDLANDFGADWADPFDPDDVAVEYKILEAVLGDDHG